MRNAFLVFTVSLALVACSERSTVGPVPSLQLVARDSVPGDSTPSGHAPVLLHPAERTRIDQNQPGLPCAPSASRGRGFRIPFVWDAVSSPQVAGYQLFVKKNTATVPLIRLAVTSPGYTYTSCNAFVADANLEGWQWMVRAVGVDGTLGPWSSAINFGFKPCRLQNGTPCFAGDE